MEGDIINRVAQSSLEIFDLEDYFPNQEIEIIDISQWLWQGVVLKEKEFREIIKKHNWQVYQNKLVGIVCSSEAIVPHWAYLLLISKVLPVSSMVIMGDKNEVLLHYYSEILAKQNYSRFQNKSVIIKGCSRKPVPEQVYVLAMKYIQPVARSVMYGEACSAVPIFKK